MKENEKTNFVDQSKIKIKKKKEKDKTIKIKRVKDDEKNIYHIINNFRGILIFTLVFSSFLIKYSNYNMNSLSRIIVVFIYSFNIQSFSFISGFLSSDDSIQPINAFKLLILYYIFNFSFSIFLYFYINEPINFIIPKYSYWYILSLFHWRITIKYLNKVPLIFIISIIISLLEGYWDCLNNILALNKTIIFFPYFIAGYKISKMKIFHKFLLFKTGIIKSVIFIICFIIFSFLIIVHNINNRITDSILFFHKYDVSNTIKERITIMIISYLMIFLFLLILPNKRIPILNTWGKNSLYIYLFHIIFTIIVNIQLFSHKKYYDYIIEYSCLFTLIIMLIFGSDIIAILYKSCFNYIHKTLLEFKLKGKIISVILFVSLIMMLLIKPVYIYYDHKDNKYFPEKISFIENYYTKKETLKESIDNAIRISFVGDLLLLKDQIIAAKNSDTGKYEFNEMFQYTSKHFRDSDFSIGVYSGPSAGNNISKNISETLNIPDEFAEAVKNAGINMVNTANNHFLDQGIEGAIRTLDVLDKNNIMHIGTYRNQEEKDKIQIVNVRGIRIAFIAYMSIVEYETVEYIYENHKYITRIIPNEPNMIIARIYEDIKNDFMEMRKESPDIIIVLIHMGEVINSKINKFQNNWNKILNDLGADIILGDHSYLIKPLQYIGNTLIVNSPGNFINYNISKVDGNLNSIIDIYINRQSKKVIGASAIPLYNKEIKPNFFSPIPIYDIINNKSIFLSEYERKKVEEIQLMSTKILLGTKIGINEVKVKYFFINNAYYEFNENKQSFCKTLDKYSNHIIYKTIEKAESITFIGDSITTGSKNVHHPWYEPMMNCFKNKKIINIAKGGYTSKLVLEQYSKDIINSKSDLYIIALGLNDILLINSPISSHNGREYALIIQKLVDLTKNILRKYILIPPWFSIFDSSSKRGNTQERKQLLKEYSLELEKLAKAKNYIFTNPNNYIERMVNQNFSKYMEDPLHPNKYDGNELYCEAIFNN